MKYATLVGLSCWCPIYIALILLNLPVPLLALPLFQSNTQQQITGTVTDGKGEPLGGVNIVVSGKGQGTISDFDGTYAITAQPQDTLVYSFVGFKKVELPVEEQRIVDVQMEEDVAALDGVTVVSTGYQEIPKERATGSFVVIDSTLFNRRVSTNVLDRIKDITPGTQFSGWDKITPIALNPSSKNTGITVRGVSTFHASTEPLIIVDNFPYEGEMSNINPNDVESITILKDAAAASIWGARSGNGVIVITTKKGKQNQKLQVDFNSNLTIINKPDLYYPQNFMSSRSYIEVETHLFNQGYFDDILDNSSNYNVVSPAVELLHLLKNTDDETEALRIQKQIDVLKNVDSRKEFNKYVYQQAINQQYALSMRGGTDKTTYTFSIGHDNNRHTLIRNGFKRTSINTTNTYTPVKGLTLSTNINYSHSVTTLNNTFDFGRYTLGYPYGYLYPYARLADEDGSALSVPNQLKSSYLSEMESIGFLDWRYRPLDEIDMADNHTKVTNLLLRFGADYQIIPQLNFQINYQNDKQIIKGREHRVADSYYVRDLVNRYSEMDETTGRIIHNFPYGDVLSSTNYDWLTQTLRVQLNYNHDFGKHSFNAIGGAEVREFKTEGTTRNEYGYDESVGTVVTNLNFSEYYPTNPYGNALLPDIGGGQRGRLNRYTSLYTNIGYNYDDKYILTFSARRDGANLFGAKTNDKFTPLWSAGIGWNVNKEHFYNVDWLPLLKLRATYGFNGNTYQDGSAYLIGRYWTDSSTGLPRLSANTAPNPQLRWEKIRNLNIGVDFALLRNILSGSIEWYQKDGKALIQPTPIAPQTGFTTYHANTASIHGGGVDVTLRSKNIEQASFSWNTTLIYSNAFSKITEYNAELTYGSIMVGSRVVGKPLNGVFSYPWAGLNPENGNPRGYLNGQISEDYAAIRANSSPDNLVYHGSVTPTSFGSLRNDFTFKGFSLSFNIVYNFGFVFRRQSTSLNYTDIIQYGQHIDYEKRWQRPGDELYTDVPSLVYPADNNRNSFYRNSEILVTPGDHIRLQDIRFGYDLPVSKFGKKSFSRISLYLYANDIGIIWRKNQFGIDPHAIGNGLAAYPNPFSLSCGISLTL